MSGGMMEQLMQLSEEFRLVMLLVIITTTARNFELVHVRIVTALQPSEFRLPIGCALFDTMILPRLLNHFLVQCRYCFLLLLSVSVTHRIHQRQNKPHSTIIIIIPLVYYVSSKRARFRITSLRCQTTICGIFRWLLT